MNSQAQALVDSVKDLGTLPEVYSKANELINDPSSSAQDLAKVIVNDQVLTSRLLRLVNSALYGFPQHIDSVSRAITIVGFRQTRDLVMGVSIIGKFSKSTSGLMDMKAFWHHSLATAAAAKILAEAKRHRSVEVMFSAGLMHDIGRLVIIESGNRLPVAELLRTAAESKMPLHKLERRLLGFTHAEVAEALFMKWNLPPVLREAVAYHHLPGMAPRFKEEALITHYGDCFAHALGLGAAGDNYLQQPDEENWSAFSAGMAPIPDLAQKVAAATPELINIFFPEH
ncbi:MAG: hypothetical protein RL095_3279 [Verrucomicrobiota bacterium]|jgi:HD-like signal output (HDOD) protein